MATPFIGTVAIGTVLDQRGFATGIGKLRSAASAVNGPMNTAAGSTGNFGSSIRRAAASMGVFGTAARLAVGAVTAVGSTVMGIGRTLSAIGLAAGLVGASVVKAGFTWTKTWNAAKAVTAGTIGQMDALRKIVFDLGGKTKFTISEVAGAVNFLGKAGNNAVEQLKLLPTMLDLAAAADVDLPRTADIMTNIAQGLNVPLNQVSKFGDMITATFLNSNVTLEHMGDTLKKLGPITKTLGIDFHEIATAIGLLGNAGIQGSEAGVHMRRVLVNLADSMSNMRTEVVDRLGLSWDQLNVHARGFLPVMKDLADRLLDYQGNIKSSEDFALASRLFGTRAVSTALALLGQLRTNYDDLSDSVRNSAGAMRDTAAAQLEGLEPFYRLQAAFELLKVSISEAGILDAFARLAEKMADFFNKVAATDAGTRRLIFNILALATVSGPAVFAIGLLLTSIGRIGQMFIFAGSVMSFLLTPLGIVTLALVAAAGAAIYMATQGIQSFQDLLGGGSPFLTMLTNIILAVVGFVAAAISGDWATAWGFAKDVVANMASVVIQIMIALLNAMLALAKDILSFTVEHWDAIANSVMAALEWLFTSTEGWLLAFALLMFTGIGHLAIGVLKGFVGMVNLMLKAMLWFGMKTKVFWGPLWAGILFGFGTFSGILTTAFAGTMGRILYLKRLFSVMYLRRSRQFFSWLGKAFAAAFLVVAGPKGIVARAFRAILSQFIVLFTALKAGMGGLTALLTNPWIIAGLAVVAVIVASATIWRDELAAGFTGMAKVTGGGLLTIYQKFLDWADSSWDLLYNFWASVKGFGSKIANAFGFVFGASPVSQIDPSGVNRLANALGVSVDGDDEVEQNRGQQLITEGLDQLNTAVGDIIEQTTDLAGTIINFATDTVPTAFSAVTGVLSAHGFNPADWVSAIANGDWSAIGELAARAIDTTIGTAFGFLVDIAGKLGESVIAPVSRAAMQAALGGLGYVVAELNSTIQDIKPISDIDPQATIDKIYEILGGAESPVVPLFGSEENRLAAEQELLSFAVGGTGGDGGTTPEDRKFAAIEFIQNLVSSIEDGLRDLFKPDDEGEPTIPTDNVNDLLEQMYGLGYDLSGLQELAGRLSQFDPDSLAPEGVNADGGGGSGPSRSLSGQLSDISMRFQFFFGDDEIEDFTTKAWIDAARSGRFSNFGISPS